MAGLTGCAQVRHRFPRNADDMKKRTAALALVAALGVGTVGTALSPALADSATGGRVTKIKDALKGLVSDGTLTQAQADKVATTLDQKLPQGGPGHGFGRHGGGPLGDAAKVLGVPPEELRTALESGKSLVDVAQGKGITKDTLVSRLLADAKTHLADRVKAGDLTQAEADARLKELTARIDDLVTRKGLPARDHHPDGGPEGPGAPPPAEGQQG